MKQISFKSAWYAVAPVLLLVLSALSTGCGPSAAERTEAARQDSIRIADSLARVEAARIEAARQDSIAKVEEFQAKIPTWNKLDSLNGEEEWNKYFTALGYEKKVISRITKDGYGNEVDGEDKIKYTLHLDDDHYCEAIYGHYCEGGSYSIKVIGAPEQLKKIQEEARAAKRKNDKDEYGWMNEYEFTSNGAKLSWGV